MNLIFSRISVVIIIVGCWFVPVWGADFFRDDFDSNQSQWKSYNDEEVSLDIRDGRLYVESREEKVLTSWNYIRRYKKGRYRVSTRIIRESGPETSDGGLALKNKAGVECYFGILGNSRYVITVYDPDKNINVLRTGSNPSINRQSNKLRIELAEGKVRFLVNDRLLEEIDNFSLYDFWIGFRVGPRIRISADYIELSIL